MKTIKFELVIQFNDSDSQLKGEDLSIAISEHVFNSIKYSLDEDRIQIQNIQLVELVK